jgi:hypothetical protein
VAEEPLTSGVLDVFSFGDHGVNLTEVPLLRPPGELTEAQNGQPGYIASMGSLEKRGGLVALNDTALAGPVLALLAVSQASALDPPAPGSGYLFIQVDETTDKPWYQTDDLATFAAAPASTLTTDLNLAPVTAGTLLFFLTDDGAGAQALHSFDGSAVLTRIASSAWPIVGGQTFSAAVATGFRNGVVYIACEYSDTRTYVLAFQVSTGLVTVVGGGPVAGAAQVPLQMLVTTDAQVFVAVRAGASDSAMYRFDLSSGGSWINEANFESPFPVVGECTALVEYAGLVYGAIQESGQAAKVIVRTTSAWTDVSHTFATATSVVLWLRVFGASLFAGIDGPDPESEVWGFDGATWALDEDILGTFSVRLTAPAIVALSRLIAATDGDTLVSRTAGGTWAESSALAGEILMLGAL